MPKANEHILIVGGTSGIGLPLAQAAHALGCTLTIAGRGAERAAAIDHLVLVPIYSATTTIKNFDVAEAKRVLDIKLTGYLETVHAALPRLKPTASIVLFGGMAKKRPYPTSTMISIANAGLVGMMNTLAVELAPIRVNSVSPGLVGDSPKWDAVVKKGENPVVKATVARTPTRRFPAMADIIHAVFFLLDNQSVNGHDLDINGGYFLM